MEIDNLDKLRDQVEQLRAGAMAAYEAGANGSEIQELLDVAVEIEKIIASHTPANEK